MPIDSALGTVQLAPSNFPNRQAFVRAAIKEAKAQAERLWENQSSPTRRGRPSEKIRTEDVIMEARNERFWAVADILRKRVTAKEKRKALKELGDLSQGKLIGLVRSKLEARNPKDGLASTPHEDTILKYAKGDRLFNYTDPQNLTVDEAKWLAKQHPAQAKSIVQLSSIFQRHQIPEKILKALSTAKFIPPKK